MTTRMNRIQDPLSLAEAAKQRLIGSAMRRRISGYTLAAGLVFAAFVIRLALSHSLGVNAPFLFFLPTVVIAAAVGGFSPGLLAALLGFVGGMVFVPLYDGVDFAEGVNVAAYWGICVLLAWFGQRLHSAQERAKTRADELAAREANLRSILETVPDAMVIAGEHGVIESFSRTAEQLFGYAAEEVVGRSVSILMPSVVRGEHDSYIQRYLATGRRHVIGKGKTVTAERKDGSIFPIELVVGEVASGDMRFFTGFIRDLTERRKDEARMQELQAELVHVSRLSAMGEMASSLAHEVNQPLSAIVNYLSGARRLLSDPSMKNLPLIETAFKDAADQALRAGDIIRRLRQFVSRGKVVHQGDSLSEIVGDAVGLVLVGSHGQNVALRIDPLADRVVCDRIQVQQVLVNLMRNAIEAMQGSDRKELAVASTPAQRDMVEVSVSDTGPGLPEDVAQRLFEPFVTSKPTGMGVGLSICRTIVESHGGRIWSEQRPEGGCVFRFTLPQESC